MGLYVLRALLMCEAAMWHVDWAVVCKNGRIGNAYLASPTHSLSPKVCKAYHFKN